MWVRVLIICLLLTYCSAAGWSPLPDLTVGRSEHCVLHLPNSQAVMTEESRSAQSRGDGLLFVVGGQSFPPVGEGALNSTSLLRLNGGDRWVTGPPLNVGRRDAACARMSSGAVVVAGGSFGTGQGIQELASIEILRMSGVQSSGWVTAKVALDPPRSGAAAAATPDGKFIIIAGGFYNNGVYLDQVVSFDGSTLRRLAPLPFRRASFGFVTLALRGVMLAFGGGALLPAYNSTVEYDPTKDEWSKSSTILVDGEGRNRAGSAVLRLDSGDEWVITTGGFSLVPFFTPMASTECYSARVGKWIQASSPETPCFTLPLPQPRGEPAATAVNSTCVVVCGGDPESKSVLMGCT